MAFFCENPFDYFAIRRNYETGDYSKRVTGAVCCSRYLLRNVSFESMEKFLKSNENVNRFQSFKRLVMDTHSSLVLSCFMQNQEEWDHGQYIWETMELDKHYLRLLLCTRGIAQNHHSIYDLNTAPGGLQSILDRSDFASAAHDVEMRMLELDDCILQYAQEKSCEVNKSNLLDDAYQNFASRFHSILMRFEEEEIKNFNQHWEFKSLVDRRAREGNAYRSSAFFMENPQVVPLEEPEAKPIFEELSKLRSKAKLQAHGWVTQNMANLGSRFRQKSPNPIPRLAGVFFVAVAAYTTNAGKR